MTTADQRLLFLSLKPEFAERILDGSKTVELRRRPPRITTPTTALIYASSPTMELQGQCTVTKVVKMAPWTLWRTLGRDCGISRRSFLRYFDGCEFAFGLLLNDAMRFANPAPLRDIRVEVEGFQPPQSFRYVSPGLTQDLNLTRSK